MCFFHQYITAYYLLGTKRALNLCKIKMRVSMPFWLQTGDDFVLDLVNYFSLLQNE